VSYSTRTVCRPDSSISAEQARDARARAWAFVFECWQEKQMVAERAPAPDARDDYERLPVYPDNIPDDLRPWPRVACVEGERRAHSPAGPTQTTPQAKEYK
jgi:hypothetical protein